jgi:4-aminobutyrate aminotransferase-like enzyme
LASASATAALLARRQRVLGPAYRLFYDEPLHLVRGDGVWVFDADGRSYLDAYNNVPSVGHCHPRVVRAIAEQAARLNTHTRYLHEAVLDHAERLLATFPPSLSRVMYTCTGSEACDLALRVAQHNTGGTGVIVTETAYHGITSAAAEMSPSLGSGVAMGAHVRRVPAPGALAGAADVGRTFAGAVDAAIVDLQRHGVRLAALFTDSIFSSDGVHAHPVGMLAPAVQVVRAHGGLFVADEVQAGFARTGEAMWGYQRHGVEPDLVMLGKPMANGMPMAAVVGRGELLERFAAVSRYFNTFGGNPVSCAAGLAVLEVIEEEGLLANARNTGAALGQGLKALADEVPDLGAVRGTGLFFGVDVVRRSGNGKQPDAARASAIVNRMRQRGVLIGATGCAGNVLKIRPPLPFKPEHVDFLLERLRDAVLETEALSERVLP